MTQFLGYTVVPVNPLDDGLGQGWYVEVGRWNDKILTISERELAGRDLTAEDIALIRGCVRHLL